VHSVSHFNHGSNIGDLSVCIVKDIIDRFVVIVAPFSGKRIGGANYQPSFSWSYVHLIAQIRYFLAKMHPNWVRSIRVKFLVFVEEMVGSFLWHIV